MKGLFINDVLHYIWKLFYLNFYLKYIFYETKFSRLLNGFLFENFLSMLNDNPKIILNGIDWKLLEI
jgi:hypothetical protein